MICPNCGHEVENVNYCSNCGSPLTKSTDKENVQEDLIPIEILSDSSLEPEIRQTISTKSKRTKIIVFTTILLFVIIVAVFLIWFFTPINCFARAVGSGDYTKAYEIYESSLNSNDSKVVQEIGESEVKKISDSCTKGQIPLSNALSKLHTIEKITPVTDLAASCIDNLITGKTSTIESQFSKHSISYDDALAQLQEISKEESTTQLANATIKNISALQLQTLYSDYNTNKSTYEKAVSGINSIRSLENMQSSANKTLSKLKLLSDSKKNYTDAGNQEKDKDYIKAYYQYKLVISDDSNFKSAQQKLTDLKPLCKTQALESARQHELFDDMDSAVQILSQTYDGIFNSDDKELSAELDFAKKHQGNAQQADLQQQDNQTQQQLFTDSLKITAALPPVYIDNLQISNVTTKIPGRLYGFNFNCSIHNNSIKEITKVVYWLSIENDKGLGYSISDDIEANGSILIGTRRDISDSAQYQASINAVSAKASVREVTFADGTVWNAQASCQ